MQVLKTRLLLAVAALLALAICATLPRGLESARLLAAQDDPARLAEVQLEGAFDAAVAQREIEAALVAGDAELAQSFLELAAEQRITVDPGLQARVRDRIVAESSAAGQAGRFARGFVTGEPQDLTELAGTLTGDLFVFGDIRDVLREAGRAVRGEQVDELILGLACIGLAVTGGTYATLGAAAPARIGLSVAKAAGRAGRMSARMTEALVRPLRAAVDGEALKAALGPRSLLQPAVAVRGVRAAVKLDKVHDLIRIAGDVGKIQGKAGTRAALDGLRLAEGPKDVERLARLAAVKGGKTRAVVKLLGRGAIALTLGLFNLASWIFWAVFTLLGFCVSLKRLVERSTQRVIDARRRVRTARVAAAAA